MKWKFKVGDVIEYRGHLYKIKGTGWNWYDVTAIPPYDDEPVVSIGPAGEDYMKPAKIPTKADFEKKVEEIAYLYKSGEISKEIIETKAEELLKLVKNLICLKEL